MAPNSTNPVRRQQYQTRPLRPLLLLYKFCRIRNALFPGSLERGRFVLFSLQELAPCFDCAVNLSVRILLCDGVSLVVELFAPGQADLELAASVLVQIYVQRDERQTGNLELADKLADLALVHEKLAGAERLDVEAIALLVRRDVHAVNVELAFSVDFAEALLDADSARTNGLDLSAGQNDADLVDLVDEIVVTSLLVIGHDSLSVSLSHDSPIL